MEVLRTMKQDAIPSEVIILTGNATFENVIESMKLGAFEYIRKPYELSELLIHVERAIENGVTREEIGEMLTHLAFYTGWPAAVSAARIADKVTKPADERA